MSTVTITEFLMARIAEDEAVASDPYLDTPDLGPTFGTGYDTGGADGRSARFLTIDPARVLAECRAKRRLVELHEAVRHPRDGATSQFTDEPIRLDPICSECSGIDDPYIDQVDHPCDTIKAIAALYAGHGDFDESWRP